MTRRIAFGLILFFFASNALYAEEGKEQVDYSILNFYRVKNYLGSASKVNLSINGTDIEKLKNSSKLSFKMFSEGVIKIEASSSSPKCKSSMIIQVDHGDERFIKIYWSSAYTFRLIEMSQTEGATEFNDEDIFKSSTKTMHRVEEGELLVKIYERYLDNSKKKVNMSKVKATGSGFFINSSGYIVSNYHVTEGHSKIFVRNVFGDQLTKYEAVPVVEDKVNDLVLLKIVDEKFNNPANIPYSLNTSLAKVGESVFALGYPLTNTMGDEVKLTNGIISARTGFANNIITYQISVPVQPGNSGGPLFNTKGQLIGIVNSIHTDAENVSYAIKSNYLVNLIDLEPESNGFSKTNVLSDKELTEQVLQIEKFVVIIEIY